MNKLILAVLMALTFVTTANAQSTVTANVHNAPGWEPSTKYTYHAGPPNGHFTRVNNGAGWTPSGGTGGNYNQGQALNNYQLLSTASPCESASSGGPTTTGSDILDGTCHWKYVGPVDYVTFSGWAFDSGIVWATGTNYGYMDVVHTTDPNLPVFQLAVAGCKSTVEPTSVNANTTLSDGCFWKNSLTDVIDYSPHYLYYTSNAKYAPMSSMTRDTFTGSIAPTTFRGAGTTTSGSQLLTITNITSGALYKNQAISGPGIPMGDTIYDQTSGSPGCPTPPCNYTLYYSATSDSTGPYTSFYGALTVSTPPTTYPLAAGQYISYPGMSNPQTDLGPGHGGVRILGGSGTSWMVSTIDTYTANSGAPFFVADEATGTEGTTHQFNVAQVWNDREYVGGANGENRPLQMWNNNFRFDDGLGGIQITQAMKNAGWGDYGYTTTVKPAPGEGFQDTYQANPSLPLAGYNANYGVGFRGVGVEGLGISDNAQKITGLQITSDTQWAVNFEFRAGNVELMDHNILEGGSGASLVTNAGAVVYWWQNLIVAHGLMGISVDYGGYVYNNTIVCPSGTCTSAMDNSHDWVNPNGTVINGNLVFGFQHFVSSNFYGDQDNWATCRLGCVTVQGTNNATDVASTDGVGWNTACVIGSTCTGYSFTNATGAISYAIPFKTGYTYTTSGLPETGNVAQLCGSLDSSFNGRPIVAGTCGITNSLSPSSVFAAWPGNYNILNTSAAYGGGASFAAVAYFCTTCAINNNTPDLLGYTRPTGSRYDIGAVQYGGTVRPRSPTFLPGGRTFR